MDKKTKKKKIYAYDSIGGEGIMALDIIKELADAEGDVDFHINSGGGSVSQGIAIYNALKEYNGEVHVRIDGLAASIASVIAMAGDTVTMAEGSLMMVHLPWTMIAGNADDLRKEAEVLDQHMETLIDIYASNSPLGRDEIKSMLAEETWLTAEEAYELGMITDIAGELRQAASVDLDRFNNAPNELLEILDLNSKSFSAPEEPTEEPAEEVEEKEETTEENGVENTTEKEYSNIEEDNFARLEAARQRLATLTKLAAL
jgi:ATP-dependent Clp protease protease subunit